VEGSVHRLHRHQQRVEGSVHRLHRHQQRVEDCLVEHLLQVEIACSAVSHHHHLEGYSVVQLVQPVQECSVHCPLHLVALQLLLLWARQIQPCLRQVFQQQHQKRVQQQLAPLSTLGLYLVPLDLRSNAATTVRMSQ